MIVTTDKCYENHSFATEGYENQGYQNQGHPNQGYQNHEQQRAFRESDGLGGFDPYPAARPLLNWLPPRFANPSSARASVARTRASPRLVPATWSAGETGLLTGWLLM